MSIPPVSGIQGGSYYPADSNNQQAQAKALAHNVAYYADNLPQDLKQLEQAMEKLEKIEKNPHNGLTNRQQGDLNKLIDAFKKFQGEKYPGMKIIREIIDDAHTLDNDIS